MRQRSDGATVLLGMPEFVVGAQLAVGRELWLMVETTSGVVGCEGCGTRAVGHGRRRLKVRDLPMADRPVVLVWAKRLWRCPEPDCAVGRWSEEVDDIAPRTALTDRDGGEHPPGSRCIAGDDEPADRRLARLVQVRGGHRCVRSQLGAVGSAVVGVASEAPR